MNFLIGKSAGDHPIRVCYSKVNATSPFPSNPSRLPRQSISRSVPARYWSRMLASHGNHVCVSLSCQSKAHRWCLLGRLPLLISFRCVLLHIICLLVLSEITIVCYYWNWRSRHNNTSNNFHASISAFCIQWRVNFGVVYFICDAYWRVCAYWWLVFHLQPISKLKFQFI